MADAAQVTLQALGAVAIGPGTGAGVDLGALHSAVILLFRVTANTGSLSVTLETSPDGATGWRVVKLIDTTNQGSYVKRFAFDQLDRWVRVTWNAEGASATFSVTGESHQLYVERYDLGGKIEAEVLERADQEHEDIVPRALIAASAEMETSLAVQHPMPLSSVPEIVRDKTGDIAVYKILGRVGYAGGGIDALVVEAHTLALDWCEKVRRREIMPFGAAPSPAAPASVSNPRSSTSVAITSRRGSQWDY